MSVSPIPEELLGQIAPTDARAYAAAKGWSRREPDAGPYAIFVMPGRDLDQLLIPTRQRVQDYARRMAEAIRKLSQFEERPEAIIVNDILAHDSDVLRYQVVSVSTQRGTLPLIDGLNLLEGAKRSILSAACSVISPRQHHPRLSRTDANQLLRNCELGQTERGSFTVAIRCPLRAVEPGQAMLGEDSPPFARRTTNLLARSVQRIVVAIEHDRPDSALEEIEGEPPVSANLCDALLRMRPDFETASLLFSVNWASSRPPEELGAPPPVIELEYDYFPIIESLFEQLQPNQGPARDLFIGQVDELRGDLGDDGRRQGEVILSLLADDELVSARVTLNADQYEIANRIHMEGGFIKVQGVLRRTQRISQLTDLALFDEVTNN